MKMGANDFWTTSKGATAKEAFATAVAAAQYENGHGGYRGTIAEKHEFTLLTPPTGEPAAAFAQRLVDEDDPRVCDKWDPAGCVQTGDGEWLFFGFASS